MYSTVQPSYRACEKLNGTETTVRVDVRRTGRLRDDQEQVIDRKVQKVEEQELSQKHEVGEDSGSKTPT